MFRLLSSGLWQHAVMLMNTEVLEEPAASMFKVEVSKMKMWPGYVGTMTQNLVIQKHRRGRRNRALYNRTSDLELWETSFPYQEEETVKSSFIPSGYQWEASRIYSGRNSPYPFCVRGTLSLSHSYDPVPASRFLDLGNVIWGKSSVPWEQLQHEADSSWSQSSSTRKTICLVPQFITLPSL